MAKLGAEKRVRLKQFREPLLIQRGISNRRRDGAMPEIPLNNPDIGSFIDQSVTATMPQHVWMDLKMLKASRLSRLIDQKPNCHSR